MCLAIPGKIVKLEGKKALIDYFGEKKEADLLCSAKVDDFVLVQQGMAIKKFNKKEAQKILKIWREIL